MFRTLFCFLFTTKANDKANRSQWISATFVAKCVFAKRLQFATNSVYLKP